MISGAKWEHRDEGGIVCYRGSNVWEPTRVMGEAHEALRDLLAKNGFCDGVFLHKREVDGQILFVRS